MGVGKVALKAIVAASLVSGPTVAQAATAQSGAGALSISQARTGAEMTSDNELGGGFIIPLLALAAIIAGILVVIDNDDDQPESP
jgi:hypothetical protein